MQPMPGFSAAADAIARSPTVVAAGPKALVEPSAAPASPATTAPSPPSSDADAKSVGMSVAPLSPAALALALRPVTTAAGAQVFRCCFPGCAREFQLKGNLKRHLNIHSGATTFRCGVCGRAFLRKADMEVHTRVHTGEKPHACRVPGCGRSFARRSDLLSHERTHTGDKPFECVFPGCGRRFARKFDLHKHQRMHTAAGDRSKPKKRRLAPSTTSSSSTPASSPCSSSKSTAAASADTSVAAKNESKSAVRQCVQCGTTAPASASATPVAGKSKMRYELKCTEDHVHSPPACFAAFNVVDSIDAFLAGDDTPDLRSLSLLDLNAPSIGLCSHTGHVFAPLPLDTELLTGVETTTSAAAAVRLGEPGAVGQTSQGMGVLPVDGVPLIAKPNAGEAAIGSGAMVRSDTAVMSMLTAAPPTENKATDGQKLTPPAIMTLPTNPEPQSLQLIATSTNNSGSTSGLSAGVASTGMPVCVPVADTVDPVLNYSRHSRSCGHLSIQHGNHRDYVVRNHLVCQDSIKKLGERARSGSNCSSNGTAATAGTTPPKCAPKDSHGPGCGHLPVRHHDHIDYVVEDNLFCQREGWLDDADNIELLDDDFWEFYGAIGSLNPDELQPKGEHTNSEPSAIV